MGIRITRPTSVHLCVSLVESRDTTELYSNYFIHNTVLHTEYSTIYNGEIRVSYTSHKSVLYMPPLPRLRPTGVLMGFPSHFHRNDVEGFPNSSTSSGQLNFRWGRLRLFCCQSVFIPIRHRDTKIRRE